MPRARSSSNRCSAPIADRANVNPAHIVGWVGAGTLSWIPVALTLRVLFHALM